MRSIVESTTTPPGARQALRSGPTLVDEAQAALAWAVADFVVRRWDLTPYPGDQAPPHIHHKGDEAFCVIEGRLEVLVGDRRRALGPGDYAFVPAGTIHTFATLGDKTARVMVVMTPQIDALVQALHAPGAQDWDSVWERHDSEMVQLDDQDRRI